LRFCPDSIVLVSCSGHYSVQVIICKSWGGDYGVLFLVHALVFHSNTPLAPPAFRAASAPPTAPRAPPAPGGAEVDGAIEVLSWFHDVLVLVLSDNLVLVRFQDRSDVVLFLDHVLVLHTPLAPAPARPSTWQATSAIEVLS